MFGYVSLGGLKFKAFFWEVEEPEWYECVVLCSPLAIEHQVVSLHFRVPVQRAFLDDKIELTEHNTAMVEKCKSKLRKQEKIGHKLSFMHHEDFEQAQMEAKMEAEIQEMMLSEESAGTPNTNGSIRSDFDGGMFYEAEVFGGSFVDEEDKDAVRKSSSIKLNILGLGQILDSTPEVVLTPRFSLNSRPSTQRGQLGQILTTPVDHELSFWSMDLDELEEDYKDSPEDELDVVDNDRLERSHNLKKFSTTEPSLKVSFEMPDKDFDRQPALLERQPAFVSTRGKEREIWQTYRAEITATWKGIYCSVDKCQIMIL